MHEHPDSPDRPKDLPRNTILLGDTRTRLRQLPPASVDCVITSPPYFAVRDYDHDEQLGHEPDIDAWAERLRAVCHDLARVLQPAGALWLNLGDSYARRSTEGAPTKSLLLGPSRVALALLRDGWVLRNQVVWAKTNSMPSSVADRLTTSHETFYLFVRSRRYFFDLDAIRQPLTSSSEPSDTTRPPKRATASAARLTTRRLNQHSGLTTLKTAGIVGHPLGKNPGDVWSLPTAGFRGTHFAVFPPGLVERPLLATCPERVCTTCGQPWQRRQERHGNRLLATGDLQPICSCVAGWRPGVVLDPFFGSGTVGVVAKKHRRDWLGIELNPAYAALAVERLHGTPGKPYERSRQAAPQQPQAA